jgi:hypothetical protein
MRAMRGSYGEPGVDAFGAELERFLGALGTFVSRRRQA